MSSLSVKMWSMIAILVATLMLAFAPAAKAGGGDAPRSPSAIAGEVVNADGRIVAGAEVRLLNEDGKVVQTTRTGPRGRFEFAPIRPGRYIVQSHKLDVGRGSVRALAKPGEVARVKITLKK